MLSFLCDRIPKSEEISGRYFEPFVGGGAVFFFIAPSRATLSDANPDLIDIYRGLRYAPRRVWKIYAKFGDSKQDYHRARANREVKTVVWRAARMLYLNRTCFKGMWRHNQNGDFNIGYGGQERRWAVTQEDLLATSRLLRAARVTCCDFQVAISEAKKGDFLFVDPPYRPGSSESRNDHYLWWTFEFKDQERLSASLQQAKYRQATWAMTNSSHPSIVKLYKGSYALEIPKGTGKIPGSTICNSGEVLITSYKTKGSKRI